MHILLVASAFNSLTQRVHAELRDRGHGVAVELALSDDHLRDAVRRFAPELIVAPMLRTAIPRDVWSAHTCLIVHPGPVGDRGPSSLDWAVHEGVTRWGVTVLQAEEEMDAGDVWASVWFSVPQVGKSDLYRNEVSDAALTAVLLAVDRFASGTYRPQPQDGTRAMGGTRPYFRQQLRRIDWRSDSTETVLRKLRAADSSPGVLDELLGGEWFLHGGHPEDRLRGRPGELLATRAGAVCRATADGAVWIPELRARRRPGEPAPFKLPAVLALGDRLPPLPEDPVPPDAPERRGTWTDIRYEETGAVGHLTFSFPGGAMSTTHCTRLLDAYRTACSRPTSVLVLGGGRDFFSNGIHLNVIEAAADPAEESWANINAINDLVQAVLTTTDRLVIAAVGGNAAAGGAMLALAADEVWCRKGSVLNPHYRLMGLSGSEYWTRTLPHRVGPEVAERLVHEALPLGAEAAERLGLVDRTVACRPQDFPGEALRLAVRLASSTDVQARIARKKTALEHQEAVKPLAVHRQEELAAMRSIFFDPDAPYHLLRRAFVCKEPPVRTPHHIGTGVPGTRRADPSAGRDRNVTATAALAVAPGPADC
ncbi:enoyl-CoA hydratase-related protein [Streptomyces sp. NBC_00841]|uniref:enoyl-CoA hydratase-related protein n=1 Tax=unclassified Streptomyces TaxID=2593676 RepID=UPI002254549F|nr:MULTISPECIES: enoyl-CoA hydratase-related protein [unclassified Streptomyces]MCX4530807.1 enoyl-CoA hydratase-related protein [Streptomyces sp. NBC_01669]WSA03449.1 enoyl-CoA hydratase-related protein [Streptomyces sp. NBC_00841]